MEALSYGLPALPSRIPANTEVVSDPDAAFPAGGAAEWRTRLEEWGGRPPDPGWPKRIRARLKQEYDWDQIAASTLEVYREAAVA